MIDGKIQQFRNEFEFLNKAVDRFKDDIFKLQKAPSEEEFLVMRTRMDGVENTMAQQVKKVDQAQKALKQIKAQYG